MRLCELREKEVINAKDCSRLGHIADIEFDTQTGCICQLIIPVPSKFYGLFGCHAEYTIGWKCVRQLGNDIILVDVDLEQCFHEI